MDDLRATDHYFEKVAILSCSIAKSSKRSSFSSSRWKLCHLKSIVYKLIMFTNYSTYPDLAPFLIWFDLWLTDGCLIFAFVYWNNSQVWMYANFLQKKLACALFKSTFLPYKSREIETMTCKSRHKKSWQILTFNLPLWNLYKSELVKGKVTLITFLLWKCPKIFEKVDKEKKEDS